MVTNDIVGVEWCTLPKSNVTVTLIPPLNFPGKVGASLNVVLTLISTFIFLGGRGSIVSHSPSTYIVMRSAKPSV